MADQFNLQALVQEHFAKLPKVVQDTITSADVEKHLRELADTHKLHLDQWQTLENEVMMALLGVTETKDLAANIKKNIGVPDDIADALTADISKTVFGPIRDELERELGDPIAKEEHMTDVEALRVAVLADEKQQGAPPAAPVASPVIPATPPTGAPTEKAVRAPVSTSYKAGEPSAVRTSVADDPYREPPA